MYKWRWSDEERYIKKEKEEKEKKRKANINVWKVNFNVSSKRKITWKKRRKLSKNNINDVLLKRKFSK